MPLSPSERYRIRREKYLAKGRCQLCGGPRDREGVITCKKCLDSINRSKRKLRDRVIASYGGKCTCCGESNRVFLTLDHVNDDGYLVRTGSRRGNGDSEWSRALREPENFTILCFNCNSGRAINGGTCPHKEQ